MVSRAVLDMARGRLSERQPEWGGQPDEGGPAERAPGMAFWGVAICSVLAWLRRNDDENARNGVLGRYDFLRPSQAMTKR